MNQHLIDLLSSDKIKQVEACLIGVAAATNKSTKGISNTLISAGCNAAKWNIRRNLLSQKQLVKYINGEWVLTSSGLIKVKDLGFGVKSPIINATAKALLEKTSSLPEPHKGFCEEALICFDNKALRAAVVYTWSGAFSLLRQWVVDIHLKEFNVSGMALTKDEKPKYNSFKKVKNENGMSNISDRNTLEIMRDAQIIDKGLFETLIECLARRNRYGHPSTAKLDEHTAAAHIDCLIENVFKRLA